MIHAITGLPGSGKTLYSLDYVRELAKPSPAFPQGRAVYYNGIRDLKLPWIELENPKEWFKLPDGAIILLDECQGTFRIRATGSAVPDYVAELETHRHHGFDIVLITQHPMLLDTNVRRLVGRHFHVMRALGLKGANIHEFSSIRADPDTNRDDSVTHKYIYPKENFALYHSAEVHTHKARIPARVFFLGVVPLLLGGLGFLGYKIWTGIVDRMHGKVETAQDHGGVAGVIKTVVAAPAADDYLLQRKAVIPGLAFTAPVYRSVTAPTTAPYPAACIESHKGCECYSQQGTRLADFPVRFCTSIVAGGFFIDWNQQTNVASSSTAAAAPGSQPDKVASVGVDRPGPHNGEKPMDIPNTGPAVQAFAGR